MHSKGLVEREAKRKAWTCSQRALTAEQIASVWEAKRYCARKAQTRLQSYFTSTYDCY